MPIGRPRGWELPESMATPEALVLDRRKMLQSLGGGAIAAGVGSGSPALAAGEDPSANRYPVTKNPRF